MPSVHSYFHKGEKTLKEEETAPVIALVSGGADSVALFLRLISHVPVALSRGKTPEAVSKERLHVLHVNHGIRGLSAQEDAEFVEELSARYGISCTVREVPAPAYALEHGIGLEAAARELRYGAAEKLASYLAKATQTRPQDVRILTAHNADDVAETFFMRALTGSGAAGLSAIPTWRGRIVRPFLHVTHEQNCEYVRLKGESWCEDETNRDQAYFRNFVRHALIAPARARDSHAVDNVVRTSEILAQENAYLEGVVTKIWPGLLKQSGDHVLAFDAKKMNALDIVLARRVLKRAFSELAQDPRVRFESRHIDAALELVSKEKGTTSLPGELFAEVSYGYLTLTRATFSPAQAGWLSLPGFRAFSLNTEVHAQIMPLPQGTDPLYLAKKAALLQKPTALFDYAALGKPPQLWIGNAQPGDSMRPYGMNGHSKRVSSVMREAHIPDALSQDVVVVKTEPDGEVLALLGVRQSEIAKVSEKTTSLLVVQKEG